MERLTVTYPIGETSEKGVLDRYSNRLDQGKALSPDFKAGEIFELVDATSDKFFTVKYPPTGKIYKILNNSAGAACLE